MTGQRSSNLPPLDGPDPIAIIGLACRLPGDSNSPSSLWDLLERGKSAVAGVPESRFNLRGHFDGSRKPNTLKSAGAMFLENVELTRFDADFFGISRQEATAMDPQQRQLLEVVYECLENAGVTMDAVSGARMGCFVASSTSDYRDLHARDPEDRPADATVGLVPAILSNRISYFFNLKGPSMTIDTACSASLVSLDVASKYMRAGDMNAAIVAGVHLWLSPEANMDAGTMGDAFSRSGKCHTFDAKADGYIKAEGVNAILIKRLKDAIEDRDPIRAVIRGTATNSDGKTHGIANPSAKAQAAAIKAAYANAGIKDLAATSYLECHGTGTLAGDPVEVQAAASVLCHSRGSAPLIIGSIKSNVGHSECSAGISGVIKTVLALEKGSIPGTPTFVTPNPRIDFRSLKVQASRTLTPWPTVPFRRASVNSFGFGGSNAHVILEEASCWAQPTHVSSFRHSDDLDDFFSEDLTVNAFSSILVMSAKDENSLMAYVEALRKHLMYPAVQIKLEDLAYTLSKRRTHHSFRGYIVTNELPFNTKALTAGTVSTETPRVGFVFTGQGAQWPEMGKSLIQSFPIAKELLRHMDSVLQQTQLPPTWSLLREISEPRPAEVLRKPELSQPLVTALQIIIVEILRGWGIEPIAVVGHSSGEIAAAYCAGHLSIDDAIKIAFHRGQAAITGQNASKTKQGMLAVGLGPQMIAKYLEDLGSQVEIACFNSPNSITLSGTTDALEAAKNRLEADGHFARMLHVDLAYHSKYMVRISDAYRSLLDEDVRLEPFSGGQIAFFSSVSGQKLDTTADASYWQKNMVSPVYFHQAVETMILDRNGADYLVEIGPSGALASPISEIKASLPKPNSEVQYYATMQRGEKNVRSLFDVAGRLFISGAKVDITRANRRTYQTPSIITDLPNYVWNHNAQYWHESEASKDWRFRMFPPHDLIGSKVLGTSWHAPIWKKDLKVDDIPWLKDHKLGSDIVVPGAAMIVMAIEAIAQMSQALHSLENKPLPDHPCYRVRDATFSRALVLEEGKKQTILIALVARVGSKDSWYNFTIRSLIDGGWEEHSQCLVRIEEDTQTKASQDVLKPLVNSTPGALWYQAMEDVGYALGPAFQKHLEAESLSGTRNSRSTVSLREPRSTFPQSRYQMHPTSVDAILQVCAPALWNGNRTNINAVIIPAIIDDLVICPQPNSTTVGMAIVSSTYTGLGDPSETKNYTADVDVYDIDSGHLLFQLSKLHTSILNTRAVSYVDPIYCSLSWKQDITFLSPEQQTHSETRTDGFEWTMIDELIDLLVFKSANLKVIEAVTEPDEPASLWADNVVRHSDDQPMYQAFQFLHKDAKSSLASQEKYGSQKGIEYIVGDVSAASFDRNLIKTKFDLVILKMRCSSQKSLEIAIQNSSSMLRDGGHLLIVGYRETDAKLNSSESPASYEQVSQNLSASGMRCVRFTPVVSASKLDVVSLAIKETDLLPKQETRDVHLLQFVPFQETSRAIVDELKRLGWKITLHEFPFSRSEFDGTVFVIDHDPRSPLLSKIRQDQWAMLQELVSSHNRILWLTEGSQFKVEKPENAQIHGLMRTIRDEDPSVNFTTLDVEDYQGKHTVQATHDVLEFLRTTKFRETGDYEFVERDGRIYISRVLPDSALNTFTRAERDGADLITRSFHDSQSRFRLRCERVGNLDSLKYHELDSTTSLGQNQVEIEISAAGLNFKDIAISTGLIPGNEGLLGFEGAGIVKQSTSDMYHPGQHVLFTKPGSFANRIVVEAELVHQIPDKMSFEEAATLGAVFPVAIYSLFDLANAHRGSRVLIHSAAGGLGIACIQLCQYIGAEVYATVGNDQKRDFLRNTFGISPSRIFNSRSTSFAKELFNATRGEGVDVIINSLTGDLLEESWNCIRDGGTMVELGKRDIIERNYLPMEPFSRNVSYRSFDISHKSVSKLVMARLLKKVFDLLANGHIKPISPMTTFPFEDVTAAFRHMRDGKHMGKIVISNGLQDNATVLARPALRSLHLRDDVSYLIVGGLKGLCGSIALSFARHGARHIIVMGRSGFDDNVSQRLIRNVEAEGCEIHPVKGDVTSKEDVESAFKAAAAPVGGVVQGAMVVRGRLYQAMTADDYHVAVACKVQGTWNLHNVALEKDLRLDFFSILSSTSGVAGQSGQANYVAANAFLDAFASYRQSIGLRANSIALGPMWDVGYMSRNKESLPQTNTSTFTTISEALFHKIIEYSILQQIEPISEISSSHLITGMAIPLKESSTLRSDARFIGLFGSTNGGTSLGTKEGSKELQLFQLQLSSQADPDQILDSLIALVGPQLAAILRIDEPIDPAGALRKYGMESLAAVELRNWVRMELRADVTMLEILNATSVTTLCEKILTKIQPTD